MMLLWIVLVGYGLGALPMGFIFVRLIKKQDITKVGSGRTGGTNAMRAGGLHVGVLTGLSDLLKGYLVVLLAKWIAPEQPWLHVAAGAAAVIGHNWSIWLYLLAGRFSAGAGTGPNVGAAMGFWPGIALVAVPVVVFFVFVVGYASVASIATAAAIIIVFIMRAANHGMPWEYVIYGMITASVVTWALRDNIERLAAGTERRVGIFAKTRKSREQVSLGA